MELLTGAVVLLVVLTGTATLTGHPILMIVIGVLLSGVVLLVTRGREIRTRRRAGRRPAGSVRAPAAGNGVGPADAAPAGPVIDTVPKDRLAPVPLDGRTSAAVVLGTAGLFLFNVLLGPLAIGLGVAALRRGAPGRWRRPAALAAVLLGIADLLVLVILLGSRMSGDGFQWHS